MTAIPLNPAAISPKSLTINQHHDNVRLAGTGATATGSNHHRQQQQQSESDHLTHLKMAEFERVPLRFSGVEGLETTLSVVPLSDR